MENQPTKIDKNKLILPSVILLVCIILSGFYYASQVSKQKSIERQQIIKLEEEKRVEKTKKEEAERDKQELEDCLAKADRAYFNYAKLNGTENKKTGIITADNDVWDRAEKTKQADIANCYKKYPQ